MQVQDSTINKPDYAKNCNTIFPTEEDIACELQLQVLGNWEPLDFKINQNEYLNNIKVFENKDWFRPFQPKKNVLNNRESVLLYGLEKDTPTSLTGLSHIEANIGRKPKEDEFIYPTEAAKVLSCLQEVFNYFDIGRTFFIRLNAGGFYPYHRDHIRLNRETFRLIAFLGNHNENGLHWTVDGSSQNAYINHVYYVDTRKTHRLNASKNCCDMVVMNVKKDWLNVNRLLTHLKYQGG